MAGKVPQRSRQPRVDDAGDQHQPIEAALSGCRPRQAEALSDRGREKPGGHEPGDGHRGLEPDRPHRGVQEGCCDGARLVIGVQKRELLGEVDIEGLEVGGSQLRGQLQCRSEHGILAVDELGAGCVEGSIDSLVHVDRGVVEGRGDP